MGWRRGSIERRLQRGRLHRLHRGVYAVGHTRLTLKGRWMAAVLSCGPDALLSHHAAAALWDLRPAPQAQIDVTAPGKRSHHRVRCHVSEVPPEERTVHDGIPVTTPERTLLDYAEMANERQLLSAMEAGQRSEVVNFLRLRQLLERSDGRRGVRPVRAALASMDSEAPWLHPGLEEAFRDLIRRARLPMPRFNVIVEGELVDAYWPEHRLVVELDSWGYHRSRRQFESDRRRDAKLTLARIRVLRLTHERITHEPQAVIAMLRRLIGSAPP